ncbi:unnamed protein product [Clonostachys rosea]|uniref:Zn(2)-C6 fungal-type domain-containing protein n=1 Tax=Bionectria ochroleuca TaxID=29856 RepID=A0ABY6TPI4_BIOOC|nr:unnamed protein product [Clonostachys rosea]
MSLSRTGCRTCKIRRVKCDEAKPKCRNCIRSNRDCVVDPATRNPGFQFYAENSYASGDARRPRGPRPSLATVRPRADIVSQAKSYYVNYYLYGLSDNMPIVSASMLECLTAWNASRKSSELVDLALSSVALAAYSRVQRSPPARKEAVRAYSQLLHVVQGRVMDAGSRAYAGPASDATLLTILLMATYECIMHNPDPLASEPSGTRHSWSHHTGALTVLRHWYNRTNQGAAPSHGPFIRQARRGTLRFALMMRHSLPSWLQDGSLFGESGLELEFDKILLRAINLRSALSSVLRNTLNDEARTMMVEAARLEEAMGLWQAKTPNTWAPTIIAIPEEARHDLLSPVVRTYDKPVYAAVWVQYYAVLIVVQSTLLRLCHHIPESQWQYNRYKSELDSSVKCFASNIPFALDRVVLKDVDTRSSTAHPPSVTFLDSDSAVQPALALSIAWPVTIVSNLDTIASEEQRWFRAQLARLGRVLGDGTLECAAKGGGEWA